MCVVPVSMSEREPSYQDGAQRRVEQSHRMTETRHKMAAYVVTAT